MPTVRQYVTQLRDRQTAIALSLGSDLRSADKRTRVVNLSLLALLAVLVKVLVDNGVITNQALTNALDGVMQEQWPDEPDEPR